MCLGRKESARDLHLLRESSEWGRYFQTLVPSSSQFGAPTHGKDKSREDVLGTTLVKRRGEPRDSRALGPLVVVLGVGECDRVPLGKASGAWCAGP